MGYILVIEDDLSMREIMEMLMRAEGHKTDLADNGLTGLELALKNDYDLIISDIRMPGLSGLELLKRFRENGRKTTLILISAYATTETAVEAMRYGAYDFIPKPFRNQDLLAAVNSALTHRDVDQERQALVDNVKTHQRFGGLVGSSPAMLQVYDLIVKAAMTNTSIIITGESGTGKELVARAVHDNSARADKSFVAINCGGIPEQLVDSELFGYKKGSFTGAMTDKQGLVTLADGGTLFLDELAELPLPMQVKLLRLAQEKTYRPVGGNAELTADIRFIAATNKNLETEIMAGRFREDLYYRLNVINIQLPPLRERPNDIPLLAHYFLEKYSGQQNKDVRKLSTYALDILQRYHFPGNVRELENIIERSVALEQSNIILPESLRLADFKRESLGPNPPSDPQGPKFTEPLAPPVKAPSLPPEPLGGTIPVINPPVAPTAPTRDPVAPPLSRLPAGDLDDILASLEVYYLVSALIAADGRRGLAAKLLGISPWRIRVRITALGLSHLESQEMANIAPDLYPKPPLPLELAPDWAGESINLDKYLQNVELRYIFLAMRQSNDNKTEAAMLLGLTLRSLAHRIARTNYDKEAAKLAILEGYPPK
ncbi:MAG: sigma 54-interacting transcriptional regulator [Deltaproteobacteria bacterium]|nr:sigma 54-interacting transcriptional regulator [Deltaproteobacteria bacterium]